MSTKSCTLSHRAPFTAEWRTSRYGDLPGALVAAWRKHKRDWVVDGIARGPQVVLDREALARAFDRMDELISESPKATPHEAAAQALREMAVAERRERREA